jgi:inhibitor of cysteine peptidase
MRKITAIVFALFINLTYAASPMSLQADKKSPTFTVTLKANPTTGYQWSVIDFNKTLFTLAGKAYQKPKTNLIGAGGNMVFTFQLNKGQVYPKKATMSFSYARPWESKVKANNQQVVVHFQ